ncbi:MAG: hypothetical protein JNL79_14750 [Myxococcales bacterium]|nr:hypothetical protein [Myxococcales bacterium]
MVDGRLTQRPFRAGFFAAGFFAASFFSAASSAPASGDGPFRPGTIHWNWHLHDDLGRPVGERGPAVGVVLPDVELGAVGEGHGSMREGVGREVAVVPPVVIVVVVRVVFGVGDVTRLVAQARLRGAIHAVEAQAGDAELLAFEGIELGGHVRRNYRARRARTIPPENGRRLPTATHQSSLSWRRQ